MNSIIHIKHRRFPVELSEEDEASTFQKEDLLIGSYKIRFRGSTDMV